MMIRAGVLLIVLSFVCWLLIVFVPVLGLDGGGTFAAIAGLAVAAEVVFWLGLVLAGRETWKLAKANGWRGVPVALWSDPARRATAEPRPLRPASSTLPGIVRELTQGLPGVTPTRRRGSATRAAGAHSIDRRGAWPARYPGKLLARACGTWIEECHAHPAEHPPSVPPLRPGRRRCTGRGVEVRRNVRRRPRPAARGRRADGRRRSAPAAGSSPCCPRWARRPTSSSGWPTGCPAGPPLRELDALLSVGESISCALAAMAVHELGSRAVSLTGRQAGHPSPTGMHGNARLRRVQPAADPRRAGRRRDRAGHRLPGGLGRRRRDDPGPGRLGRLRGGRRRRRSGCRECEIFTDVPGGVHRGPAGGAGRAPAHRAAARGDAGDGRGRRRRCCSRGRSSWPRRTASTSTCAPASPPRTAPGSGASAARRFEREPGSTDVAGVAHRRPGGLYCARGCLAGAGHRRAGARAGSRSGAVVPGRPATSGSPPPGPSRRGDRRAGRRRRRRRGARRPGFGERGQPGHRPQARRSRPARWPPWKPPASRRGSSRPRPAG